MPDRPGSNGNPAPLLILMVLLTGWTPVAARDAMNEMPALTTGLLRFGIAAALLTLTVWLSGRGRPRPVPIARSDYGRLVLAAALCVPVNQSTFLLGVKLANASHAALFYALNPVLVYIITVSLGRTVLRTRMALAAVLAFAGAAVVGWDGLRLEAQGDFLVGDLLLFGAVLSWAIYSVVAQPLSARYGAVRTLAIVMVVGSLMYLPVWWIDSGDLHWDQLSWRAIAGFAYITVGTSYLNYMLWLVAMNRFEINRVSVMINAAPLVAVLFAWLWHDEPISGYLSLGATLIFAAITLANWKRRRAGESESVREAGSAARSKQVSK